MSKIDDKTKRKNFEKLATIRLRNALTSIRLLGNLANPRAYSYDQKDVSYIKNAISKAIGKMEASFKSKVNKSKVVRNPKTNQKIFKDKSYKIHFKVGKILHNRINIISDSNE